VRLLFAPVDFCLLVQRHLRRLRLPQTYYRDVNSVLSWAVFDPYSQLAGNRRDHAARRWGARESRRNDGLKSG
jgi:hypothetical protein